MVSRWLDGSLRFRRNDEETYREGQPFKDDDLRLRFDQTCYNYELPDGTLLYQQCRYDPSPHSLRKNVDAPKKRFFPRRPVDPQRIDRERNIGDWLFGPGVRRVIYNWPAIMRAGPGATVFVTEGEKNADHLVKAGLLATTVLSHKWTDECIAALNGYEVIILADHDKDGLRIASEAQASLSRIAKTIRVVPCAHLWKHLAPERAAKEPGLNADVSDWLEYGGDPAKLIDICRELPAVGAITAEPHNFPPEASIPQWEFLYGTHLLRKTVAGTAATGATGKSSMSIAEALAMTTGKPLLNVTVPQPLRVLLINLEDNRDAMNKRIAAAMKHYGLKPEYVGERLFTKAKGEIRFKVAKQVGVGSVQRDETTIRNLVRFMVERSIDVLIVDPFIATHGVNENDNSGIRDVIECYNSIAEEASCAVHLLHHTRKAGGTSASIKSARGASSFVDACRSVRILETMSKEDAQKLKLERAGSYFRSFSGKINFAPPSEEGTWYKIVSVELNNAGPLFGDDVGVVTRWGHPGAQKIELAPAAVAKIMEAVGHEPRWRDYPTADMWVGKAIAPILNLDLGDDDFAIKSTIKQLKKMGALKDIQGKDVKRQIKTFVVAGAWRAPGFGSTDLDHSGN